MPSKDQQIIDIYIEEIQSEVHQTESDRKYGIINRIQELTGKRPKPDTVKKQILRLRKKKEKYGSYNDRRTGGKYHVITENKLNEALKIYNKHKNRNQHSNLDEKISKKTGISRVGGTWYNFKRKLNEKIANSNNKSKKKSKTRSTSKQENCTNKSHSKSSGCCQICNGSVQPPAYPAFECQHCHKFANPPIFPLLYI